ncbi:MAG: radical SAM protein [Nanoarchaeota archaeon]
MKILLVNPNIKRKIGKSLRASPSLPPMGISYLAAVLRKERHDVKILDMNALNMQPLEIIGYLKIFSADVVGFSVTCPAIYRVFKMAEKIKEIYPDTTIILGGPHPSSLPEESIEKKFVDFVIMGEGEQTILELIKEIEGKKRFASVEGIAFQKNGKVLYTAKRERICDLDSLPFPAIDLLPLERYKSNETKYSKFMTILTSRGCPGKCNYCNKQVFGDCCLMRSAENIIKEIEFLIKKYGYREFHIVDDLFTNDRKRIVKFCNMVIDRKLNIKWKCGNGVRVGSVDLELLKLMKKAGCYSLGFGIESGSQQILNNMKKGQTLEQCENAVRWAKKAGINTVGFFMLGNLGEDEKTMQETIDFAKKIDVDIAQFMILTPYPKTPIREVIEKEGKIFENNWENYGQLGGVAIFEHGKLKKELMEKMYKKAYKEFYWRPEYILKRIFRRRTLNELKGEINGFLTLIEM